jgi:branched-chain amino acid transport system ATP-binding protein
MPDTEGEPLLACNEVIVRFGGLVALDRVDLTALTGQITGLIGPNGAGKTTLFNVLTGVLAPTKGNVSYQGQDITSWPPHRRGRAGIARTFQRLELFIGLTVYDNLLSAYEASLAGGVIGRQSNEGRQLVDEVIERLGLQAICMRPAGELPTGQGRLVELGRAMCTSPKLLLLDEPSSGLDSAETSRFRDLLLDLVAVDDIGILLVEHDMGLVMEVCDAITVLDFGRVISCGTPDEVRNDPAVIAAYLGGPEVEVRAAAG